MGFHSKKTKKNYLGLKKASWKKEWRKGHSHNDQLVKNLNHDQKAESLVQDNWFHKPKEKDWSKYFESSLACYYGKYNIEDALTRQWVNSALNKNLNDRLRELDNPNCRPKPSMTLSCAWYNCHLNEESNVLIMITKSLKAKIDKHIIKEF